MVAKHWYVFLFVISITFIYILNSSVFAKRFGSSLCKFDEYYCHKVKRGESWERLFKNPDKRDMVMRINRMNTDLYPGLVIAIPNSNHIDSDETSPFPTQIDAPGINTILISLSKQAFGAYDPLGSLLHWGPISAAKGYCPDVHRRCTTPVGQYTIYSKGDAHCKSTRYPVGKGGAPMPYCMYFRDGFALHGSYTVPGYHDSHGCIRLFVKDAKWLNQDFTAGKRTRVIIQQ